MTQPAEPTTNGVTKTRPGTDGLRPWPEICSVLRRKVSDLLRQASDDDAMLRHTQLQVRESLAVIGEALQKYGCVSLSLFLFLGLSLTGATGAMSCRSRTTAERTASSC